MYEFLEYQVQDVMARDVVTLSPDARLRDAEALFEQHDFNCLPVVDESGELVGVLTKLDLLRAFEFDDEHMFPPYAEIMDQPAASVMTREVRSVRPRTPLHKALHMMVELRCKSLPVVDGKRVVGVVAREDVMRALARAANGTHPAPLEEPY